MRLKAGIYTRVSSDEQKHNHSLGFQDEFCQHHAKSINAEVVEIYEDAGYSGKDGNRPAFQRLLADVRAKRLNAVIVYNISRFSRNTGLTLTLKEEFEKLGVIISSATEIFDNSPAGEFSFTIHAAEAQAYRRLSRVTTDGKFARAKKGLWNGYRPYGYAVNPDTKRLDIDPFPAQGVKLAFTLCSAGHTDLYIAQRLNEKKHRTQGTHSSRPFSKDTVRSLLTNVFYTGVVKYKHDVYPGTHEPIITKELYNSAQAARRKNRRSHVTTHATDRIYELAGILFCKSCGNKLHGQALHNGIRYYRDRSRELCQPCDQRVFLRAEKLESQLSEIIGQIVLPTDYKELVLKLVEASSPAQAIEEKIESIKAQLSRLSELFIKGIIEDKQFYSRRAALERDLDSIQPAYNRAADMTRAADLLKDFTNIYRLASPEKRKRLFRFVIEKAFTVSPPDGDPHIADLMPTTLCYPLLVGRSGPDGIRVITAQLPISRKIIIPSFSYPVSISIIPPITITPVVFSF